MVQRDNAVEPGLLQGKKRVDKGCRHRIDPVDAERADIRTGDAIAIDLRQTKSFSNESAAPLELMIVGIARDMAAKTALLNQPRLTRK